MSEYQRIEGVHVSEEPVAALRVLVGRAAGGDADSWEVLFRRSYPRIFSFARRRLSSDHAADDAVSETMLRALDRIESFTWQGAGFDAWLYGIARNVIHETHRSTRRTTPVAEPDVDLTAVQAPGPLEGLVAAEQRQQVRQAFARLSAEEQELLELRVVMGLDAEAVGEVVGRQAGAVRMAQSRALGRLRTFLREVDGGS